MSTLFEQASLVMPGGVNSPVRAFNGVGGTPCFVERAKGPYLYTVDGHELIDYIGAWGPMIVGHSHPSVVSAVSDAASKGLAFGVPTDAEVKLAKRIIDFIPWVERVRLMNSGTEATMTALRLARAATGRDKIIKFEGCYHGHSDSLLVKAGSGALTLGTPSSPGITYSQAKDTLVASYNDIASVEQLLNANKNAVACIIVEPVAGNMGCVLPQGDFLRQLRALCTDHQCLLIIDEVMTGFRVGREGAHGLYGIEPDLLTLGKVIGGGLPVGALVGCASLMDLLAPAGDVYQAGTFSGNPVVVAAGLATLDLIDTPTFYHELTSKVEALTDEMQTLAKAEHIPLVINRCGGMFSCFFSSGPVIDYASVCRAHVDRYKRFFHAMLAKGVMLPPSAFECWFMSSSHSQSVLEKTLCAVEEAFSQCS